MLADLAFHLEIALIGPLLARSLPLRRRKCCACLISEPWPAAAGSPGRLSLVSAPAWLQRVVQVHPNSECPLPGYLACRPILWCLPSIHQAPGRQSAPPAGEPWQIGLEELRLLRAPDFLLQRRQAPEETSTTASGRASRPRPGLWRRWSSLCSEMGSSPLPPSTGAPPR